MNYREEQKKILEYKEGLMAIPAVPGAGKTFILTHLAKKLITEEKHKPGKILIVTYMKSAAGAFKAKLAKLLEENGIKSNRDFEVMTIHSLAMEIVRTKPDNLNLTDDFNIIDDPTKNAYIDKCVREWRLRNQKTFTYYLDLENINNSKIERANESWHKNIISMVTSLISEFKCNEIELSKLKELTKNLDNESIIKWVTDIYESYDKKLKMNGLIDYDDLLFMAYKSLSIDKDLCEKFQNKYSYIMEDEAQDSNPLQQKILFLLCDKYKNIIRVGDSNQSIMSTFTSSDPKLFRKFCKPPTKVENMFTAGRSTKDVIDVANFLVKWTRENHPIDDCNESLEEQPITPVKKGEFPSNPVIEKYGIACYTNETWEDEIDRFIKYAKMYIQSHPDKTVAVLVPTSNMINDVVERLEELSMPYDELSFISEERFYVTKVLGKIIAYVGEPDNNDKFIDVVKIILDTEEYENFEEFITFLKSISLEKIIYPRGGIVDMTDIPDNIQTCDLWIKFNSIITFTRKLLEFPLSSVDRLMLYITEYLSFDQEQKAVTQKIAFDLRYLFMMNPSWTLNELSVELLKIKNNIFNFFASAVYEAKGYEPVKGKIAVCTYHKSKGLEWDCVFLLGLTNSNFPATLSDKFMGENYFLKDNYKNPTAIAKSELHGLLTGDENLDPINESKKEIISEKIRLLYVGITRAKENLLMMCHKKQGFWNVQPSKYFVELNNFISNRRNNN